MMAERWRDILLDLESAKRHFSAAGRIGRAAPDVIDGDDGYDAAMALQHAMMAGYTSFEMALKRLLAMLGEELPIGPDWHATLLRRVSQPFPGLRPAIFSASLVKNLGELMRFRHVAMHAYDSFEFDRARPALAAASRFVDEIDEEFSAFRAAIDPD